MVFDTFIAANTAKGFFSFFDELLYSDDTNKVYLIKGGPGCGKSTFMKKIAEDFKKKGYTIERILCSSDKDSLDGIKIKQKGVVIIDATSPHVYDMKYPGAYESIIDFSVFWDEKSLQENYQSIKQLTDDISARYRQVYNLLKAAGGIEARKALLLEQNTDGEKIVKAIKKIIKQNAILKIEHKPKTTNRMLSAFTKDGIFTLSDTVNALCDECVLIDDSIGLGYLFMGRAAAVFNKMGYDTIRFHSPLLPESRTEQLIIPQLRIGFITSGNIFSPATDSLGTIKKINSKSFLSKDFYANNKNKLSFEKRLVKEILNSVSTELGQIKELHDKLEHCYVQSIDYKRINEFTTQFINKI